MKIKEIGFVGVPVTDMKRAREFYEGILGLKQTASYVDGAWVEYDIGRGTLALANVNSSWQPSDQGSSPAFEVDDFEESINYLRGCKVQFAIEPFETPGCFNAVIQDPDGNKLMIHKMKPERE